MFDLGAACDLYQRRRSAGDDDGVGLERSDSASSATSPRAACRLHVKSLPSERVLWSRGEVLALRRRDRRR